MSSSAGRRFWIRSVATALTAALITLATGLLLPSFISPALADDAATLDAQRLFKQFVDLEHAYDPAQADLFASSAVIKDTRVYQDGPTKTYNWTGDNYRAIIKAQLPVQKVRGEQYNYSQVSYMREGNNVRIKCTRSMPQRKFSAPFELLLAPSAKQGYKIIEETFQSQP